jgi:hypothetical protein
MKMSKSDLTKRQARLEIKAASQNAARLFSIVRKQHGPRRAQAIYKLLSAVRFRADAWRKMSWLSKARLISCLPMLSKRNFRVSRSIEYMLLRSAISDRRTYSAWAKVATLAHKKEIAPEKTAKWIKANGGIDQIIRGVGDDEE